MVEATVQELFTLLAQHSIERPSSMSLPRFFDVLVEAGAVRSEHADTFLSLYQKLRYGQHAPGEDWPPAVEAVRADLSQLSGWSPTRVEQLRTKLKPKRSLAPEPAGRPSVYPRPSAPPRSSVPEGPLGEAPKDDAPAGPRPSSSTLTFVVVGALLLFGLGFLTRHLTWRAARPAAPDEKKIVVASKELQVGSWQVEPAGLDRGFSVTTRPGRGEVLEINLADFNDEKLALSRSMPADLSRAHRVVLSARSSRDAVELSVGLTVRGLQFRSDPRTVPGHDRWVESIAFDLDTDFTFMGPFEVRKPVFGREEIGKVTLYIESAAGAAGTLSIDALRGDRGELFAPLMELPTARGSGSSLAIGDYDQDGDLDLAVGSGKGVSIFENRGGDMVDRTEEFELRSHFLNRYTKGCAWADADLDGDLDLVVTPSPPALLENVNGRLVLRREALPPPSHNDFEGLTWLDLEQDGDPDLIVTNGKNGILLYENSGANTFTAQSERVGLGRGGLGQRDGDYLTAGDFDDDGYPDFVYSQPEGLALRNEGGRRFMDVTAQWGLEYERFAKRGLGVGDFDNDGDLDLILPKDDAPGVLRNDQGVFTDIATESPDLLENREGSFGAVLGDLDRDGWMDLIIRRYRRVVVFRNQGGGRFARWPAPTGTFDPASLIATRSMALVDIDHDGDLDLIINRSQKVVILINQLEPLRSEPARGVLVVSVDPRAAPGTRVTVRDEAGMLVGTTQLGLTYGLNVQVACTTDFGVAPGRYQVRVTFTTQHEVELEAEVSKGARTILEVPLVTGR